MCVISYLKQVKGSSLKCLLSERRTIQPGKISSTQHRTRRTQSRTLNQEFRVVSLICDNCIQLAASAKNIHRVSMTPRVAHKLNIAIKSGNGNTKTKSFMATLARLCTGSRTQSIFSQRDKIEQLCFPANNIKLQISLKKKRYN